MRQVVLDTETTGLDWATGHRVIEIGAVELVNRRLTKRSWHTYLCPQRAVDSGALAIHGLSDAFLADKPRFVQVLDDLAAFIEGAELVIHNAPFDVAFLDAEFALAGYPRRTADLCQVLDTLALARHLHAGQRNTLDALCRRYQVDNSARERHGALLDAELLAEVYLAMTGGQVALLLDSHAATAGGAPVQVTRISAERPPLPVPPPSPAELLAHQQYLERMRASSAGCVWPELQAGGAAQSPG